MVRMSLPEQPPGDALELLQTIWDLAFDTGNWPTFTELDHRWDSGHNSDVVEVLHQLPEGFTNGIDLRTQPQGTTRIGLTVAGAAVCKGAQETLSAFLDFIRVATGVERNWQPPPDNPEAQPGLTDQEYLGQAQELPTARRKHLLQMLFLLIHSEPSVWMSISGPNAEGHWRVTLNRQVRPFRDVTDLDSYWDLRYKSWEASPKARIAALPEGPADDEVRLELLTRHPQILGDFLLDSIYTATAGNRSATVACEGLRADIDLDVFEAAVRNLESQGRIQLHWPGPAPALPHATLTASGAAYAESARERWNSQVFRRRAARDALLAWLHDFEGAQHGPFPLAGFLRDPRRVVDGHFFSRRDIDGAATYLCQKGLMDGRFADDALIAASLTAEGIDCMEQGGNVAEYLTPHSIGVTYNFHAPVSGTNVALGDHATQYAAISSVDADSLRVLMKAVVEALPSLNMDLQAQKDVENATSEVVSEVGEHQADRPRLSKALLAVRGFLARAGNQALAAVLGAAIDYERAKLGLPPAD
jgi:hypothetical protein